MLKNIFSFQLFIFCSCDFCFQSIFRPLVLQTKAILLNLFQRKRNDSSFFKRIKSAKKLVAFIGSTKNKNGHKMYRPKYVCEIKRGNVKIVCVLFVVVLFAQANYTIHKIHQQISHFVFLFVKCWRNCLHRYVDCVATRFINTNENERRCH